MDFERIWIDCGDELSIKLNYNTLDDAKEKEKPIYIGISCGITDMINAVGLSIDQTKEVIAHLTSLVNQLETR